MASLNIQVAMSELLCIVAKFYTNIMPLRPSDINMIYFPSIGNRILVDTQTAKVGPTLAPIKKCGKLAVRGNTLITATYTLPL